MRPWRRGGSTCRCPFMNPRIIPCLAAGACAWLALGLLASPSSAQTFRYEPKAKVDLPGPSYASPDPAPRMMLASEALPPRPTSSARRYLDSRQPRATMAERIRNESPSPRYRQRVAQGGPRLPTEQIPPGQPAGPFAEE